MIRYLVLLIFVSVLFSCKKEGEKPMWDVDVVTPLVVTTMTISDIVNDTVLQINTDSTVSLVYKNSFYDFNLDEILKLPDTTIEYTAKLSNLIINDIIVTDGVSLGDIAMKDKEDNGPTGSVYLAIINGLNNGQPTDIPATPPQDYSDITLDATDYFETLTVSEGFIDITIENQLPMPITDLIFVIKNEINQEVIVSDTFAIINSNETVISQKILSNITIEGILKGNISLQSPGASDVIIDDTARAVIATINIHNIKISSALARFPNQNIIELNQELKLDINDKQINELTAKTGSVVIEVHNTLSEAINFEYTMPKVKKNNQPLVFVGVVPAVQNGGVYSDVIDLSEYEMDMRGVNNDTVNALSYTLTAAIDSTGNLIELSLTDSIYLLSSFNELVPKYAEGWFGNEVVSEVGETDIEIIPELKNANVNFNDVRLSISIENQVGVKAGLQFNSINAINTESNTEAVLDIPSSYSPFIVEKPINPGNSNVIPTYNEMLLNESNSNPSDLINILPNKISYNLDFKTNYGLTAPAVGTGTDFIYNETTVKADLNIEIPLSFVASNIVLTDTVDLNISNSVDEIESGMFYLFSYNEFPLDAVVQVYLLDANMNISDSLFTTTNIVYAGSVNNVTGRVESPTRTRLQINLPQAKFFKVLNTEKVKIVTRFDTKPNNEHVKIYSDYEIKFKLTGDFTYKIR